MLVGLREGVPGPGRPTALDVRDAPEGFGWAILQALAKEPERRPPTATAYAHMLALASGLGHLTSP